MGRSWQCGTIQVDFSMPDRFKATYEAEDGTRKTPVMVHRAILGSLERFIGILIENHAGRFPLWLNPVQAKILPVADRFADYARRVATRMTQAGIRAEADVRNESLRKKVRDAQLAHVNYQFIVGGREEESLSVSVRTRNNEDKGAMPIQGAIDMLIDEISRRAPPTVPPPLDVEL
jgi:threonyl-tRNA synthetase